MKDSNPIALEYHRANPQPVPCCLDCYSPLDGIEGRCCPDCGRQFDPQDPSTMHMGRRPGWIGRFFLRPVGWPMHTIAAIATLPMLCGGSVPGGYVWMLVPAMMLWFAVGAIWTFRVVAGFVACNYYVRPYSSWLRHWRKGIIAPVLAIVTLLLLATGTPVYIAFLISRPAMERLAEQTLSSSSSPPPRWVGVFPVQSVEGVPGGMRFTVRGADFMDISGFAYAVDGVPDVPMHCFHDHLSGHWYTWRE